MPRGGWTGETIRLVITSDKLAQDDIIRAPKNFAEIVAEIRSVVGQEPDQIKLRSVVITEKHVELLNDLDILEVTFKQGVEDISGRGSKSEQDSEKH